jgi:branched-chain amino acid transport system permease protein
VVLVQRSYNDPRLLGVFAVLALYPLVDICLPTSLQIIPLMPPVLIFALVGLGLCVATGFTGLLHLGVAAFIAIGAYTFAIATCSIYPFQLPWVGGVILAGVIGSATGALLALPTMRLRGDYLAIVTLGFGEIVQDILRNLEVITKGTQGINPLRGPAIGSFQISSLTPTGWYYLILAILIVISLSLQRVVHSPIGRAWFALRDDELAASCMGVNPARTKLTTFAISAGLCAIAGALLASFLGSSGEPSNYDFQVSIMALSMIIVGGLGSIPGAILGAVIMVGINSIVLAKIADALSNVAHGSSNVLLSPANWKYMIFGLTLVLMMRFKSEGLMPPRQKGVKR